MTALKEATEADIAAAVEQMGGPRGPRDYEAEALATDSA